LASSLASAATLAVNRGWSQPRVSKTIRIGHLGDFSSGYAMYSGPVALKCTTLAVEDFKAKNPGVAVEIVSADHQNKPDIASSISQKWIDENGVDAITDVPLSACVFAVQEVVKAKNKLLLGANGNSPRITNENCSINSVHWPYSSQATGSAVIKALLKDGAKTFFFLTVDNATGHSSEEAATKVIEAGGGKVLGSVQHPFGVADFSSFVLKAQGAKADAIVLANAGPDVVNSIKTINEFGLKTKIAALQSSITDVNGMGLKIAQGLSFADAWYWNATPETRAFAMRVFPEKNTMPNTVQVACYSVVSHYLNAVNAVGSTEPQVVVPQMRKTRINDIFAKDAYLREDGRLVRDLQFYRVKAPEQSKEPWDYLDVVSTISAAEAYPLSESTCSLLKKT
jgi:branched-chain amino acid transport system substrate-binding protein